MSTESQNKPQSSELPNQELFDKLEKEINELTDSNNLNDGMELNIDSIFSDEFKEYFKNSDSISSLQKFLGIIESKISELSPLADDPTKILGYHNVDRNDTNSKGYKEFYEKRENIKTLVNSMEKIKNALSPLSKYSGNVDGSHNTESVDSNFLESLIAAKQENNTKLTNKVLKFLGKNILSKEKEQELKLEISGEIRAYLNLKKTYTQIVKDENGVILHSSRIAEHQMIGKHKFYIEKGEYIKLEKGDPLPQGKKIYTVQTDISGASKDELDAASDAIGRLRRTEKILTSMGLLQKTYPSGKYESNDGAINNFNNTETDENKKNYINGLISEYEKNSENFFVSISEKKPVNMGYGRVKREITDTRRSLLGSNNNSGEIQYSYTSQTPYYSTIEQRAQEHLKKLVGSLENQERKTSLNTDTIINMIKEKKIPLRGRNGETFYDIDEFVSNYNGKGQMDKYLKEKIAEKYPDQDITGLSTKDLVAKMIINAIKNNEGRVQLFYEEGNVGIIGSISVVANSIGNFFQTTDLSMGLDMKYTTVGACFDQSVVPAGMSPHFDVDVGKFDFSGEARYQRKNNSNYAYATLPKVQGYDFAMTLREPNLPYIPPISYASDIDIYSKQNFEVGKYNTDQSLETKTKEEANNINNRYNDILQRYSLNGKPGEDGKIDIKLPTMNIQGFASVDSQRISDPILQETIQKDNVIIKSKLREILAGSADSLFNKTEQEILSNIIPKDKIDISGLTNPNTGKIFDSQKLLLENRYLQAVLSLLENIKNINTAFPLSLLNFEPVDLHQSGWDGKNISKSQISSQAIEDRYVRFQSSVLSIF